MKYKVRITKAPDNIMAYGGQSGYGLDLGQRGIYDNMNESGYDSVSDTAQPVPRSAANIEAELGETMVGDLDDDGRLEHMKIGGKPHSKGGTPLNVKPGTFVFSQTKKMAFGGPALEAFGKSGKKKYTPAQLAKQYDLNKHKAVMENPEFQSDPIAQRTAQMMYENNAKKLGMLALMQEGMKGFPQGIPDIARSVMPMMDNDQENPEAMYGGYFMGGGELEQYQTKGQVTDKITKQEFQKLDPNVWKIQGNRATRTWKEKIKDGTPGTPGTPGAPGTPPSVRKAVPGGTPGRQWEEWIKGQLAKGVTIEELAKQGHGTPGGLKKFAPYYKPATPATPATQGTPGTPPEFKDMSEEKYFEEEFIKPRIPEIPNTPPQDYGSRPFFGNSLFVGPQRERFYAAPINAMVPEPTFYDPNRELAANAEQANITQQYLSGFGSPQAFMANASATQGKALENSANINARYQNQNVQVANQFSPLQTDIMNKVMAYQADRADKLFYNNEQGRKAYRNNMRQWLNNVDRYRENEYEVNSGTNMLNQTNPYYDLTYGRKGASLKFRPGINVADLITGNSGGSGDYGVTQKELDDYEKEAARLKSSGIDASIARDYLQTKFPRIGAKVSSASSNLSAINSGYFGMLSQRGLRGSGSSTLVDQ
jgi:hypothetical protein